MVILVHKLWGNFTVDAEGDEFFICFKGGFLQTKVELLLDSGIPA